MRQRSARPFWSVREGFDLRPSSWLRTWLGSQRSKRYICHFPHKHGTRPAEALDSSTELWTMPTSNHQRQQRRATARRAAVATDDVPDAVPRPKGRGPRNHFWDPRPPGVRRHNESNEPNQRRAARLASARGRHADAVRGRRWSRINAARCNEAKSFQAPASSASWRGLHGPSRRPGGR